MRRLQAIETFPRKVELPVITQMSFLPAVEVVTLWVNVVVVGLVIFDVVVDFFVVVVRLKRTLAEIRCKIKWLLINLSVRNESVNIPLDYFPCRLKKTNSNYSASY